MPSASFSHATSVRASPGHVWGRLQDPATWASLGGLERLTGETRDDAGNLAGFAFELDIAGKAYPGTAKVVSGRPPAAMSVSVDSSQMAGRIDVGLAPDGDGTRLDVTMSVRSRGFLATISFPLVSATIGSHFAQTVDDVAARLAG